jgi:microcystin-dependent protein
VLYTAIGTTYGTGDGSTTFNLPELRGEFIRGLDDSRGVDTGRVLGSSQAESYKSHTHSAPAESGVFAVTTGTDAGTNHLVIASSTGTSGGTETRPRNVALLAYIKY